jgi:hypothetical protein
MQDHEAGHSGVSRGSLLDKARNSIQSPGPIVVLPTERKEIGSSYATPDVSGTRSSTSATVSLIPDSR